MKYVAVLCLGLLAGCAGDATTRATSSLAIACDSFATVLDTLTPLRREGKISAANVTRVNAAINAVTPVCKAGADVDPEDVIGVVDRGVQILKLIKDTVVN